MEQRRQLHARIARSRRRMNRRVGQLVGGRILPHSWRRQIEQHPVLALVTATGAGMLLAQICSRRDAVGQSTDQVARWLAGETWTSLLNQMERFLATAASPAASTAAESTAADSPASTATEPENG